MSRNHTPSLNTSRLESIEEEDTSNPPRARSPIPDSHMEPRVIVHRRPLEETEGEHPQRPRSPTPDHMDQRLFTRQGDPPGAGTPAPGRMEPQLIFWKLKPRESYQTLCLGCNGSSCVQCGKFCFQTDLSQISPLPSLVEEAYEELSDLENSSHHRHEDITSETDSQRSVAYGLKSSCTASISSPNEKPICTSQSFEECTLNDTRCSVNAWLTPSDLMATLYTREDWCLKRVGRWDPLTFNSAVELMNSPLMRKMGNALGEKAAYSAQASLQFGLRALLIALRQLRTLPVETLSDNDLPFFGAYGSRGNPYKAFMPKLSRRIL